MNKNSFLIKLCESERTSFGRIDFALQTEPQKVFSAIWELESQVNNGGFDQYLRNSDSGSIEHAPSALRTIGALSCAEIVERAIEMIEPLPPTHDSRVDALAALSDEDQESLAVLDSQFFAYPDNLTDLLYEFIRKFPDEFGPVAA